MFLQCRSVHVMADALLANLRSVGWESPILMFRGGWFHSAVQEHLREKQR